MIHHSTGNRWSPRPLQTSIWRIAYDVAMQDKPRKPIQWSPHVCAPLTLMWKFRISRLLLAFPPVDLNRCRACTVILHGLLLWGSIAVVPQCFHMLTTSPTVDHGITRRDERSPAILLHRQRPIMVDNAQSHWAIQNKPISVTIYTDRKEYDWKKPETNHPIYAVVAKYFNPYNAFQSVQCDKKGCLPK